LQDNNILPSFVRRGKGEVDHDLPHPNPPPATKPSAGRLTKGRENEGAK